VAVDIKAGYTIGGDSKQAQSAWSKIGDVLKRSSKSAAVLGRAYKKMSRSADRSLKTVFRLQGVLRRVGSTFKKIGRVAYRFGKVLVDAFLASVPASNKIKQAIERLGGTSQELKTLLGAELAPAVAAFGETLRPFVERAKQWAASNREVVNSGIEDLMVNLITLGFNVAQGALYIAQSYLALKGVWKLVASETSSLGGRWLEFVEMALRGYSLIEQVTTGSTAPNWFDEMADKAEKFGQKMGSGAKEAADEVLKIATNIDKLQGLMSGLDDAQSEFLAKAIAHLKQFQSVLNVTVKASDAVGKTTAASMAAASQSVDSLKIKLSSITVVAKQIGTTFRDGIVNAISDAAFGMKSLNESMEEFLKNFGQFLLKLVLTKAIDALFGLVTAGASAGASVGGGGGASFGAKAVGGIFGQQGQGLAAGPAGPGGISASGASGPAPVVGGGNTINVYVPAAPASQLQARKHAREFMVPALRGVV